MVIYFFSLLVFGLFIEVHRGIKGIVIDGEGNAIKGALVSVRGIRHNITTGDKTHSFLLLFSSVYVGLISLILFYSV